MISIVPAMNSCLDFDFLGNSLTFFWLGRLLQQALASGPASHLSGAAEFFAIEVSGWPGLPPWSLNSSACDFFVWLMISGNILISLSRLKGQ